MAAASATATDVSGGFVWVAAERLRALEALEAGLPAMLEKAKADRDKERNGERFKMLHEKQKESPESNRKRVLSNYHKNKDEINARRREAYRLKKETATGVSKA